MVQASGKYYDSGILAEGTIVPWLPLFKSWYYSNKIYSVE